MDPLSLRAVPASSTMSSFYSFLFSPIQSFIEQYWLILLIAYFVPTVVAMIMKHKNTSAIFVLNFFLGFTYVGWVVALVWAVKEKE